MTSIIPSSSSSTRFNRYDENENDEQKQPRANTMTRRPRQYLLSSPSPLSFVVSSMNREAKRQRMYGSQKSSSSSSRPYLSPPLIPSSSKFHGKEVIFHDIESSYKAAGIIPYVTNLDGTVSVLMQRGNGGYNNTTTTNHSKIDSTSVIPKDQKITDFGGKREKRDLTSIHCAVREFFEEVGQELKPYFTEKECVKHLQHLRDTNQLYWIYNRKGGCYVVYFLHVYHDPVHFNRSSICKTRPVFPIRTSVYSYDDFDVQNEIIRDKPEEGVQPLWIQTNDLIELINKNYQIIHPRICVSDLFKAILRKI